jgi:hypothetical protein
MIQTTLGVLVDAKPALDHLADRALPPMTSYAVARLLAAVQVELTAYETARGALVKKFGVERDATEAEQRTHGPTVTEVRPADLPAFLAEHVELRDIVVTLAAAPVALSALGDAPIAPRWLVLLGPLLAGEAAP